VKKKETFCSDGPRRYKRCGQYYPFCLDPWWGAKYNFSQRLGARLQAKWSPTYIATTIQGFWCDPFWGGCWVVGNSHFTEMNLTLVLDCLSGSKRHGNREQLGRAMTCSSCRITVCITRHAHQSQEWLAESGLCLRDLRASTKRPASARRAKEFIGKFLGFLVIFLTLWTPLLVAQEQTGANPKKPDSGLIGYLLNYLNMAGTKKSNEFEPMTQAERQAVCQHPGAEFHPAHGVIWARERFARGQPLLQLRQATLLVAHGICS
jgi:hypothetical protein